MISATVSAHAWTATLTNPHTDPCLHVTVGFATVQFRVDLARVITRSRGSLVSAVATEAVRLLRRKTGYAPTGSWARTSTDRNAFTVPIAEMPGRCETCVSRCECRAGSDGCEHLGCRGQRTPDRANTCPGVAVLTAIPRNRSRR
ncbi:hypothetical protein [Actinoplanes derwentensis]|uniref:Uncharacterized protein n=1 Tax=Actinoplanes derwentensis TaxID=113562 RepID=A0A1H2CV37_9ACTN|nr:hypothetical protein [Actinoplanes derwentensis]GID81971.1 hypothetical protein Ade03nite_08950 [Actinoplanes derwentensis]SDT74244.1 hypothetical protein SAMN04489716_6920 [Actinoplanes derwentensis]